jgi:hypothetical protein
MFATRQQLIRGNFKGFYHAFDQPFKSFLTQNGFIAVLKQRTMATMPATEAYRIADQEPAHYRNQNSGSCPQQQMRVVRSKYSNKSEWLTIFARGISSLDSSSGVR